MAFTFIISDPNSFLLSKCYFEKLENIKICFTDLQETAVILDHKSHWMA